MYLALVSWKYLRFLNFINKLDWNSSNLGAVSTANVKIYDILEYFVIGSKQNLKIESNGMIHSCKHQEQSSEIYFASLKKGPAVFVVLREGQLCNAYHKDPFDHFSATGEIQRLIRLLQIRIKQCRKKRKWSKITKLCQDICHINTKHQHCQ